MYYFRCLKEMFVNDSISFDIITEITKYSKREIDFTINFSIMCETYPKLQLTKVPLRIFKQNLSLCEFILNENREFWQQL